MKDARVVEVDELMLPPAADSHHARSGDRAALPRSHPSLERGVMEGNGHDPPADEVAAELDDGTFDFRKFRHVR